MIRTIIVDDEPLARQLMRTLLAEHPEVEVVGEFASSSEALKGVTALAPDLVLLDIQMPGIDGLQLGEMLTHLAEVPTVVFVTAYDEYAIRAFEVHAVDYLLKPVAPARLAAMLARVGGRRDHGREALRHMVEALATRDRRGRRIAVRVGERTYLLRTDEIEWVEADGKFVKIHVAAKTYSMRETMKSMEARLDATQFLRVSRSAIVNLDRVREIQPWFNGDYMVIMQNGAEVATTRSHRDALRTLLERM